MTALKAVKWDSDFMGKLAPGTMVFACELIVYKFDGPEFNRQYHRETGLNLWD